ncbi:unnamed protein product [Adineta steineri]|uniref:NAD(P)(+)--arginine ADP-ribosyltransferase n=1 Tax=Adineta steineri TaxID=433720 RepID=A0A818G169_9BILA|nr:unnamed protein product [Adineta steineri]
MAAKLSDEPQHVFRFSDFTSEPRRMLPPILGYEKEPLVSLEEAIQPLIPLVPEVERMTWTVKQNHFDGAHGLTDDEAASIILYTMEWEPRHNSFYIILNNTLQAANRQLLKPWFLYLRLIMTSLAKLPADFHRLTVYRGVKLDLSAQYIKGSTVTWWGFSSCTTSVGVLSNDQFLGQSGTRTLFTIDCSSAKSIKQYSLFSEEEEILLPPARQFQVIDSLNSGNGLHIIQLKEIQPRFPLINPVPQAIPHLPIPHMPKPTPLPDPSKLLKQPKCNDPTLQKHIDAMYLDQTLTTLDLGWNQIGAKGAQDLANALRINKTLTTLDLGWNRIGDQGAQNLANALQINKTLTTLDLGWNQIGAKGAQDLANALQINKTLTTLDLGCNEIGAKGAEYLANALQINKTLTTLDLGYNEISDQGAQDLAYTLQINETLNRFNIGGNKISAKGAEYLANALRINKVTPILVLLSLHFISSCTQTLTTLDLEKNVIGAKGAQDLGHALQINKVTIMLGLLPLHFTSSGAQDLADALQINKTLTTLDLRCNHIGAKGAQYLANALQINKVTTIFVLFCLYFA